MTLRYLGSLTLGQCVPTALQATAALNLAVLAVLPALEAKLAGLVKLQVSLTVTPPSIAGQIEATTQLLANLKASAEIGLPGVDFQLAAVAKAILQVEGDLGKVQAQASLAAGFEATLGTAGVHAYSYEGRADQLGDELEAATGNGFPGGQPNDACFAVVFAATAPEAIAAMGLVFVQ